MALLRTYLSHWQHIRFRFLTDRSFQRLTSSNSLHTSSSSQARRRPNNPSIPDRSQEVFPRDTLDQGNVMGNKHLRLDVRSEIVQSGFDARQTVHPYDAASATRGTKAMSASGGGNPEQIGYADQVGAQSATADHFVNQKAERVRDSQDKSKEEKH